MNASRPERLVLGFDDYEPQAKRLAAHADLPYSAIEIHRFPDGESLVRLPEKLPSEVVFCRSLDHPNDKLIELELAAAAAVELGARRLLLVAPYLCYMRQDRSFHPGEAVSQRVIGRLLARRFDTVITVDPHLHRTHELAAAVPVRRAVTLSAAPVMAEWLGSREPKPVLLGPDEESEQWVGAIARSSGCAYAVARKRRLGDREVRIDLPEFDFSSRPVVIVDDIASTGKTLAEAARRLASAGAARISVLVTHALFVGDALDELRQAGVSTILSTDSIAHETNGLELAPLLAAALDEADEPRQLTY